MPPVFPGTSLVPPVNSPLERRRAIGRGLSNLRPFRMQPRISTNCDFLKYFLQPFRQNSFNLSIWYEFASAAQYGAVPPESSLRYPVRKPEISCPGIGIRSPMRESGRPPGDSPPRRPPRPNRQKHRDYQSVDDGLRWPGFNKQQVVRGSGDGGNVRQPMKPRPGCRPQLRIDRLFEVIASGTIAKNPTIPIVMYGRLTISRQMSAKSSCRSRTNQVSKCATT